MALIDAPIISGVILLAVKNVRVLGGRVPALADSWDLDRKMKIILKAGGGKSVDGPRPPPFTGVHIKGGKAVVEPPTVTQSPAQAASDANESEPQSVLGPAGRDVSQRSGGVAQQRGEAGGANGSSSGGRGGNRQRGESVREGGSAGGTIDRGNDNKGVRGFDFQHVEQGGQRRSAGDNGRGAGTGREASGDWRNEPRAPFQDSRRFQAEAEGTSSISDGGGAARPRESVRMRPGAEPYRPRPRTDTTATPGTILATAESSVSSGEQKGLLEYEAQMVRGTGEPRSGGVRSRGGATSSWVGGEGGPGQAVVDPSAGKRHSGFADNGRDDGRAFTGTQAIAETADSRRDAPSGNASAGEIPLGKLGTASQKNERPEPSAGVSSGREKPPDGGSALPQAAAPVQNKSAAMKLLERREDEGADGFRGGRGRGRGRGGRRRRYDDDDGDVGMTLEEWEAKKAGRVGGSSKAVETDEELARRMQEQFDLEEREAALGK